ncbi:histidine phosphatase family protein [Haloimpatiens sp. FM7330]|uniref:histidine phosphatase family protein n=1 Tax=Haloimpatiens sp. FM7330 TaxID=3298610 RepID=UPI003639666D
MTKVYFVRHAKPDFSIHDDLTRPLNEEGIKDCKRVTEFLINKNINKVFSSPYKRAFDTVKDFAHKSNLEIDIIDDFRERAVSDGWIEDFNTFAQRQWEDFDYKLSNGESLNEVQKRNIAALHKILIENEDKNIVIGTHGTALSTIINYYDKNFDHSQFQRIKHLMPFIVCIDFQGTKAINIEEFIIHE